MFLRLVADSPHVSIDTQTELKTEKDFKDFLRLARSCQARGSLSIWYNLTVETKSITRQRNLSKDLLPPWPAFGESGTTQWVSLDVTQFFLLWLPLIDSVKLEPVLPLKRRKARKKG
jgi:hypothetical protein